MGEAVTRVGGTPSDAVAAAGASLLGYTLVAAAFFAGAGRRFATEQVGSGDNLESLWNAWWIGQSLLRLESPWWTDWIFAPEGTPLVWHSLVPLSSAAVAALSFALPAHLAYNLVVLAALPVAGLCAWALCRHLTGDDAASFVGGLAFMLCPFVTSKTLGHVDLLYGGLLPLFYLALLLALAGEGRVAPRRAWRLAAVCMLVLFACSPNIPVFAANLAVLLLGRYARADGLGPALRRFARVFAPTLVVALPYLVLVAAYSVAYELPPRSRADPAYDPELVSYLLPLTKTSLYSDWTRGLGFAERLSGVEPAVYLGVLVLPVAIAGLWWKRRVPLVAHLAWVGVLFCVLSLGPKLQWQGEVVEIGGWTAYLPFGLWRWLPVLGAVGQAGRYAIIVYLVMAVGVACAVASLRARFAGAGSRAAATVVIALAVCLDYAFEPITTPLPRPLDLHESAPERRRILDPRISSAETMYQQTLCERPLVGGYISRPPLPRLRRYQADPGIGWLFAQEPAAPPARELLLARLQELAVGDVLLAPGDPRGHVLAGYGFRERDSNGYTTVWTR